MDQQQSTQNMSVHFGKKSFFTVVGILFAIVIAIGILTYVIPAGEYPLDENGKIVGEFQTIASADTRLPVWRWFTAPFEALVLGQGNMNIIQVMALLLILGGTFKVLDKSGGLVAMVKVVIEPFFRHRYLAIWIITLIIMLLSAIFGLQEQLLILFPVFMMLAKAMTWSNVTAISLILITSGVGFTTAILNPFTIGTAAQLAGVPVTSGIGFRLIIFASMYVVTSLFLVFMAKSDERKATEKPDISQFVIISEDERAEQKHIALLIAILFGVAFGVLILAITIPFIAKLNISMILMGAAFIVGTVIIGRMLLGSFRVMGKAFLRGMIDVSPSVVIIMIAFSVKYIADNGKILHTIFHYFYEAITQTTPYVAVLLLYLFVLIVDFFIPSASTKAVLLIPLLTLAEIPGISVNMILLTYLFADGYTNVLFPTCGTLVVGLGLAEVSYVQWVKKTIVFQLLMLVLSVGFLMMGLAVGI